MGKLIEFYHPTSKPPAPKPLEPADPEQMPAADVFRQLLEMPNQPTDVLVLLRDDAGVVAVMTNLADLAESLLFMERAKYQMMARDAVNKGAEPPRGTA